MLRKFVQAIGRPMAAVVMLMAVGWHLEARAQYQPRIGNRVNNPAQASPYQAKASSGGSATKGGKAGPAGPTEKTSGGLKEQLDAEVIEHFEKNDLPGLVVLYARDGLLTYKKVQGEADVAGNVPMTENKVGRLNSVSKWVGSLVALRLAEQGKLDLKAKARTYVSDLPAHHTYRVVDLLACRSGVRHYGETTSNLSPKNWSENDFATAAQAIPNFWHDPLASPVGSYHYSSFGYPIADACMEEVTGKPFRQVLQSVISSPNGVPSLKVEELSDGNNQRMKFYTRKNGRNVQITPPKKEWTPSGGGMESTPMDLLKLGIRYCDGQVISASSMQQMQKRIDPNDSYCIGCSHAVENGYHVIAKSGSAEGSNAYIWLVPERRMVMVIMANRDGADVDGLGRRLRKIILSPTSSGGSRPDLVVEDFERTAAPQYKNGNWEIPIRFNVVNQGQVGANESFVNSVRVEGTVRWTGFMDALPSKGSSKSVATVLKVPDASKLLAGRSLTLGAYADAPVAGGDTSLPDYNRVKESNENNNGKTLEVKLPGGGGFATQPPNNPDRAQPPKRVSDVKTSSVKRPSRVPVRVAK